jgi:hypothetical protein
MAVVPVAKQNNHTPVVAVRLRPELRAAAEAVADDGQTLSDVIRAALAEYVNARGRLVA